MFIFLTQAVELLSEYESNSIPTATWKGTIHYRVEGADEDTCENIEDPSHVGPAVEKATECLTKGQKEISHSLIHLEV